MLPVARELTVSPDGADACLLGVYCVWKLLICSALVSRRGETEGGGGGVGSDNFLNSLYSAMYQRQRTAAIIGEPNDVIT